MVIVVYSIMTGMIIMDVISRFRSFQKYKDTLTKDSKRNFKSIEIVSRIANIIIGSNYFFLATDDIHIQSYFPFYLEYYILMALHVQFAQTALGIQRRYYRLNLAIKNIFSLSKIASFDEPKIQINI